MELKIKAIDLSSGGPFIAILNIHDAKNLDLHPTDRVKITKGDKEIVAVLDITDKDKVVKPGEIGLFHEITQSINTYRGTVHVRLSERLKSLQYIRKKLDGERLSKSEIGEIVKDIIDNNLNEVELTYFVSGCYSKGLSFNEILDLTRAIANGGNKLNFGKYPILDKHCTGGVPGNRTTMVVVPIMAAAGITMPKTSSRAISSAAGTSDTMEVLAKVEFPIEKLKEIIAKTNAFMVWGGGFNIASADDKLIRVRHPLSLDPEGLLVSSILAKKHAVGATHVLIDIPIGKENKIEHISQGRTLKRKFVKIGKKLGMKIKVVFTDGNQPIGNGIGPALEARDVLNVLQNKGPLDLRDKSVELAGIMLDMVGIGGGKRKALEIIQSGQAYQKMKEIIAAQGGNPNIQPDEIRVGKHTHVVRATHSGTVSEINNKIITKIARIAGAPMDKAAGVYLFVHTGEKVSKGDKIYTIYADSTTRMSYAIKLSKTKNPLTIRP